MEELEFEQGTGILIRFITYLLIGVFCGLAWFGLYKLYCLIRGMI